MLRENGNSAHLHAPGRFDFETENAPRRPWVSPKNINPYSDTPCSNLLSATNGLWGLLPQWQQAVR